MGVLHQPHAINTKIKRVCRLVVLPDYQGVGIGTAFLEAVAQYYTAQHYDFSIVTSAKNLIVALRHKSMWTMIRYSSSRPSTKKGSLDKNRASLRSQCKTASFFYTPH
nr:MAG TPA: acetyltransferase domain containing protein [Caudoviricetes sp.]